MTPKEELALKLQTLKAFKSIHDLLLNGSFKGEQAKELMNAIVYIEGYHSELSKVYKEQLEEFEKENETPEPKTKAKTKPSKK